MKSNRRFFAFGCSFTNWLWPTWADIVASHFDEYYNYGYSGRGNWYIYNMLLDADRTHKFTKDDTVIIQWSEWTRVDELIDGYWTTAILEQKYEQDALNRGFACMQIANNMLKYLGCEYYTMSLNDFDLPRLSKLNEANVLMHNRILENYQDIVDELNPPILKYLNTTRPVKLYNGVEICNLHPLPSEHIELIRLKFPQYIPKNDTAVGAVLDNQLARVLYEGRVNKFVSSHDSSSIRWQDIEWYGCKRSDKQGFLNVK
jgi:hypothetical protein